MSALGARGCVLGAEATGASSAGLVIWWWTRQGDGAGGQRGQGRQNAPGGPTHPYTGRTLIHPSGTAASLTPPPPPRSGGHTSRQSARAHRKEVTASRALPGPWTLRCPRLGDIEAAGRESCSPRLRHGSHREGRPERAVGAGTAGPLHRARGRGRDPAPRRRRDRSGAGPSSFPAPLGPAVLLWGEGDRPGYPRPRAEGCALLTSRLSARPPSPRQSPAAPRVLRETQRGACSLGAASS